jgi:RHS repeat-associated protein
MAKKALMLKFLSRTFFGLLVLFTLIQPDPLDCSSFNIIHIIDQFLPKFLRVMPAKLLPEEERRYGAYIIINSNTFLPSDIRFSSSCWVSSSFSSTGTCLENVAPNAISLLDQYSGPQVCRFYVKVNGELCGNATKICTYLYAMTHPFMCTWYASFAEGNNTVTCKVTQEKGCTDITSQNSVVYNNCNYEYPYENIGNKCDVMNNGTNPINTAVGNKFEAENDYTGTGVFPLSFTRSYNSLRPSNARIGRHWTHNYYRNLFRLNDTTIHVRRPDGVRYIFTNVSGSWFCKSDLADRLTEEVDGYTYLTADNQIERYDIDGNLLSITKNGLTQTLTHDDNGLVTSISDAFGKQIIIEYNEKLHISKVTTPGNREYIYSYDSDDRLIKVTYPDETTRRYLYEDTRSTNKFSLTGIIDQDGNREATWSYDANNKPISSEHAGGADHMDIVYNADGSATLTDSFGTARTYHYQTINHVKKLASTDGTGCSSCGAAPSLVAYDAQGRVASRTDQLGTVTTYSYNDRSLETSRVEAYGTPEARTVTTSWHPALNLSTNITEPGKSADYTYTDDGRLLSMTETDTLTSATRTWTYTYNEDNLLASVDGPRTDANDVTTFTWDASGRLTSITTPLGHVEQFTAWDADGRPLTRIDANGVTMSMTYDYRGMPTSSTSPAGTTAYAYDGDGKPTRITVEDGSYLDYSYDTAGRLYEIVDNLSNRVHFTLDAKGNRTLEETFDPSGRLARKLSWIYNDLNQMEYMLNADGQGTHLTYDAAGNVAGTVDALGNETSFFRDPFGRITRKTDALSGETELSYDSQGAITRVQDPDGVATTFVRDGFGNGVSVNSPDTGLTTFTYDAAGNALNRTAADGVVTTCAYDAMNRLTAKHFPDSAQNVSYFYDAGDNGKGHLTGMQDQSGVYTFNYDAFGNRTLDAKTLLGIPYQTGYAYDAAGRLSQMTYPGGLAVSYQRDAVGRVTSVVIDGVTIVAQDIGYEPFGPVSGLTYGNGVRADMVHDRNGALTGQTVTPVRQLTYDHDPIGNITGISDNVLGTTTMELDDLFRLTRVSGDTGSFAYTYDANGNRLTSNERGENDTYVYTAGTNRLASISGAHAASVAHSPDGLITVIGSWEYEYNQDNRLVRAKNDGLTVGEYIHNGFGQRTIKATSEGTTVFHFDRDGRLIAESSATGVIRRQYVYLGNILLATVDDGVIYWVHVSHRGEPLDMTDATGGVVWQAQWSPFGKMIVNDDPDGDGQHLTLNIRLPGQYFDAETGLHYNYFRNYFPELGRYVEADPIGLDGDFNLYNYANAAPTTHIDIFGLKANCETIHLGSKTEDTHERLGPVFVARYHTSDWVIKGISITPNIDPRRPSIWPIAPGIVIEIWMVQHDKFKETYVYYHIITTRWAIACYDECRNKISEVEWEETIKNKTKTIDRFFEITVRFLLTTIILPI